MKARQVLEMTSQPTLHQPSSPARRARPRVGKTKGLRKGDPTDVWVGPLVSGADLRKGRDLSQIRVTVHAARPSVRVRAADRQFYMERDADHVELQSAQESDEAFEQAMYRKSALLQQRRRTGR